MADNKARVLLIDKDTGAIIGECDILTDAQQVLYTNTKETIGDFRGIKTSTSFKEEPVQNILNKILYPNIPPSVEWISSSYFENFNVDDSNYPLVNNTVCKFIKAGTVIPESTLTLYISNTTSEHIDVKLNLYKDNENMETFVKESGKLPLDSHFLAEFNLPSITNSATIELEITGDENTDPVDIIRYRIQYIPPVYNGFIGTNIIKEGNITDAVLNNIIADNDCVEYVGDKTDILQLVRSDVDYITCKKKHPFLLVPKEWGDRLLIEFSNFNIINNNFDMTEIDFHISPETSAYSYFLYVMKDSFYNSDPILYGLQYRFVLSGFEKNLSSVFGLSKNSPILSSFNMNGDLPIDNRFSVETYSDLLKMKYKYTGLITYVKEIKTFFKYDKDWKPTCTSMHLIETGTELTDDLGGWDDIAYNVISGEVFKKRYNNKWEKWGIMRGETTQPSGNPPQLRFRYEWDVLSTYLNDSSYIDIVVHNNKSWYCKITNCSVEPGTNTDFWKIFAGIEEENINDESKNYK